MCTGGDRAPGSIPEALGMIDAALDYLNGPGGEAIDGAAAGGVLQSLAGTGAKHSAAWMRFLARFDAASAHDADGCATPAAWLAGQCRITPKEAKNSVGKMRQIGSHQPVAEALAGGVISESWAREITGWTNRLPAEMREGTDKILLDAAAAGADLDNLKLLAIAAWEQWKSQCPDPDDPDDGFGGRRLRLDTTLDGAGRITGDLTPECAAAVQAVLEALGKKRGKEDTRTIAQRFHDALQEGCELLIRSKMVPDRAGAGTRVESVISLSQLRDLPGAPVLEQAWLAARAGEHGYLAGKDAETIACDALIVPVVTGSPDWPVTGQMIHLVTDACTHGAPHPAEDADEPPRSLPPEAWQALQYAMAKLAIDFVSGPGGIASVLRTGLLPAPFSTRSVPLDAGYTAAPPASGNASCCASTTTTSASTGGAGKSSSCPTQPPSPADPTGRSSAATARPPPKPPPNPRHPLAKHNPRHPRPAPPNRPRMPHARSGRPSPDSSEAAVVVTFAGAAVSSWQTGKRPRRTPWRYASRRRNSPTSSGKT
jgi:hypothetical protein